MVKSGAEENHLDIALHEICEGKLEPDLVTSFGDEDGVSPTLDVDSVV